MENQTPSGTPSYSVNGESKCPFSGGALNQSAGGGTRNRDWWPNLLKLNILRQHSPCLIPWARSSTMQKSLNPWIWQQ